MQLLVTATQIHYFLSAVNYYHNMFLTQTHILAPSTACQVPQGLLNGHPNVHWHLTPLPFNATKAIIVTDTFDSILPTGTLDSVIRYTDT
jgi:hypothetical protein